MTQTFREKSKYLLICLGPCLGGNSFSPESVYSKQSNLWPACLHVRRSSGEWPKSSQPWLRNILHAWCAKNTAWHPSPWVKIAISRARKTMLLSFRGKTLEAQIRMYTRLCKSEQTTSFSNFASEKASWEPLNQPWYHVLSEFTDDFSVTWLILGHWTQCDTKFREELVVQLLLRAWYLDDQSSVTSSFFLDREKQEPVIGSQSDFNDFSLANQQLCGCGLKLCLAWIGSAQKQCKILKKQTFKTHISLLFNWNPCVYTPFSGCWFNH